MRAIVLSLILALTLSHSKAEDSLKVSRRPLYNSHFSIGYYFPKSYTNLRIDGRGLGINFSLERDLGYEEESSGLLADYTWQFAQRSSLTIGYFGFNKSNSTKLQRDILIRDTILTPGITLKSYFNTRYLTLGYNYDIFAHQNWRMGVSSGAKLLLLKMGFEAITNGGYSFKSEYSAPLPTLFFGIHGSAYLMPRLLGRYKIDYFTLSVEGIRLNVIEDELSLEYFILKNFGIGAGYKHITYAIREIPVDGFIEGEFEYSVRGFKLFASARF